MALSEQAQHHHGDIAKHNLLFERRGGNGNDIAGRFGFLVKRMLQGVWSRPRKKSPIQRSNTTLHDLSLGDKGCDSLDIPGRFVLIDWDEAREQPKSRVSGGNVNLRIRHPKALRAKPLLYTQVQLSLLYVELVEHNANKGLGVITETDILKKLKAYERSTNSDGSITESARDLVSSVQKTLEM